MDLQQTYIVAVSGGVDSMVLLHKMSLKKNNLVKLVVAHVDHGIRHDSHEDAKFVEDVAKTYGLTCIVKSVALGKNASEAEAREARYKTLREVKEQFGAEKIVTAHHQDDLLETMILNLVRGTGPRGLAPMKGQLDILRPLLSKTKVELEAYAIKHNIDWREDSTNSDERYLRNYIRKNIMPKLEPARAELLMINKRIGEIYEDIDLRISLMLPKNNVLSRTLLVNLSWSVQKELMRAWLVNMGVQDLDRATIERLTNAAKTLESNKRTDISAQLWLLSQQNHILITSK